MLLRLAALLLLLGLLPLAMSCGDDDDDNANAGAEATATAAFTPSTRGSPVPAMLLASQAFGNDQPIPEQYTCDGENTSPQFQWTVAPSNARAYVFIMHDPDARREGGYTHWVVYDIPVGSAHLDPGISPGGELPGEAKEGKNSGGDNEYAGPCPPTGDDAHRYVFTLYALDFPLGLEEGKTKDEVEQAMKGHILSEATLRGLYARD